MGKCEVIDGKQTNWVGLWYHPEYGGFSSPAINLSVLKKFKGTVRLYVRKNKFFNNGENGRPNYIFRIKDADSENLVDVDVEEDKEKRPTCENGIYYTKTGERLYTEQEVQYAIGCAVEDGHCGYYRGDVIVSDYLDTRGREK